MKVLIVLSHNRLTGVSTWAETLQVELNGMGYCCDIQIRPIHQSNYVLDYSAFTHRLDSDHLYDNVEVDWNAYDVLILSDDEQLTHTLMEGSKNIVIFVSHGTEESSSIPIDHLCDYKVGVSDTVAREYECDEIIYNGVNLDVYRPETELRDEPDTAVYISRERVPHKLKRAFMELNMVLLHARIYPNVSQLIQESDMVIGYGRGIYEGMACGRPVLVYGEHGCDGWIDEHNFPIYLQSNCSGYHTECQYDVEGLKELILQHNHRQGKINRRLAEKYVSSKEMSSKYDKIIRRLIDGKRQNSSGVQ